MAPSIPLHLASRTLKYDLFCFFCHFRDILDTYQSSQKFTWPFSMTALVRSLSSSSGASVWFFGAYGCAQIFWWRKIYTPTSKKGPSMSFVVYSPQLDRPYFDGLFLGCCRFDAVDISCKFFAHIIIGAQCAYSVNPVWLFRRPQFDFRNKFE